MLVRNRPFLQCDDDHWVFLTCLSNLYTMRELGDEGRDQKLSDAFTSGEAEDEEDDDWYDNEPELYQGNQSRSWAGRRLVLLVPS